MKRDELLALADAVEAQAEDWKDDTDARALARFARQIAESQPVAWRVECRWADGSSDWRKYGDYGTEQSARSSSTRFANPGDIESRVVPLFTLPLED